MTDKIFIDECLSAALVSVAKERQIDADYGPHIGKRGWKDQNIAQFALANHYVVATGNRRYFLREYANIDLHDGLMIIPSGARDRQMKLFSLALDALFALENDVANKVIEVAENGDVYIREWSRSAHDPNQIEHSVE